MTSGASAFDAVLKLGGSLSRTPDLANLAAMLGDLARSYRLLLVPGGGAFADVVRAHYRRYALSEVTAHRMALLAMDQYGHLLADLVSRSTAVQDLGMAGQVAAAGRLAILLPSALLIQADPLPNSWQVTSDSLAAWIAGQVAAPQFILLKDVDGLYAHDPHAVAGGTLWPELRLEALTTSGGVDAYLAIALAEPLEAGMVCWVINGRRPERLAELLATGTTYGTRLRR